MGPSGLWFSGTSAFRLSALGAATSELQGSCFRKGKLEPRSRGEAQRRLLPSPWLFFVPWRRT